MQDKSSLLDQLRIDRGSSGPEPSTTRRWSLWVGTTIVALALLGGGAWFYLRPAPVPVHVAVAQPVSSGGAVAAPAGTSALDASGYVVARREATVSAKIMGRVVAVNIEEGQKVTAGEVIARLDDSTWRAAFVQAQAQLAQSEASLQAAQVALDDQHSMYLRDEKQHAEALISAQTFDAAKATYNNAQTDLAVKQRMVEVARANLVVAQRNLDDTVVRAPFSGVITVKAAQAGEIVSPQSTGGYTRTGIGTLVDMDSLEVEVDVSENFINRVHPDQAATVKLNAYPDWEIPATVIAVIPTADRSKATVKVRVGFKIRDPRILPEMGARVAFLTGPAPAPTAQSGAPATVLPVEAVQASGDTGTVYVIDGSTVERRTVRLGPRTSAGQMIASGLESGTRVAVGDFSRLADKVRILVQE
jgi:RND family efflux transporter MFP subunit